MDHTTKTAPPTLSGVQTRITGFLLDYCGQQQQQARHIAPAYGRLWHALQLQVQHGGKRLRPYLCQLAYQAYGGGNQAGIVQVAAGWELLHIAMLAHDDIIDRDYVRHGQPNISGLYRQHYAGLGDEAERRHAADSAALLGGDLLLAAAHQLVLESSFPAEARLTATQQLNRTIFEVAGGELLDSETAFEPALAVSPELIAQYKTAGYSFIGPLLCGAGLAGAPETVMAGLRQYGLAVGIGYQLADDLLGTFGQAVQTGKPVDGDLREAKRTAVLVYGLPMMAAAERREAEAILAGSVPLQAAQVSRLRALLEASGVRGQLQASLEAHYSAAVQALAPLHLPDPYYQALTGLAERALRRDR